MTFQKPPHFPGVFRRGLLVAGLALLTAIATSPACQVPVFRFALERWEPDAFQIVVVRPDLISPGQEEVISYLKEARFDKETPSNIRLSVSEKGSDALGADAPLPRLEVYFPRELRNVLPDPFWSGAVTMENARRILHSPARTEITRRILSGESATWLLVESGIKDKDEKAAADLTAMAEKARSTLRIPDGVIGANAVEFPETLPPAEAENVLMSEVPLKIDFSLVRLSRENPEEEVFLNMLLKVEDDLGEFRDEPIVYTVFGRGRILPPLIGAGVNDENVMSDSAYLCGACSCQVKKDNPGLDILVSAPWEDALSGSSNFVLDKVLPPLEGTAALAKVTVPPAGAATGPPAVSEEGGITGGKFTFTPLLAVGIVVGILFASVAVATLLMKRREQ